MYEIITDFKALVVSHRMDDCWLLWLPTKPTFSKYSSPYFTFVLSFMRNVHTDALINPQKLIPNIR